MRNLLFILVICIFTSCSKNYPEYDNTPSVEYYSAITSIDSTDKQILFSFMLYDGDGNVGLSPQDTIDPYINEYQQNFYATPYYIENNDTIQLPYSFSYRIPRLRAEGQNKFIKAKVSVNLSFAKSVFPYDKIFFTYFVYDRDLNKSNIDTSAIISW